MDQLEAIERRRRNLRIVLFVIILATLPFYCAGILLWGSAPPRTRPTVTVTTAVLPSQTLITVTPVRFPSITPLTTQSTLANTPPQFFTFVPATRILSPTPQLATPTDFIFPTPTLAPTLTGVPTLTPLPSNTPIPIPSDTAIPIATDTPIPDSDGDTVADNFDACPFVPGSPPTGCPETPADATVIPPGS
jgi:hypothetical protein